MRSRVFKMVMAYRCHWRSHSQECICQPHARPRPEQGTPVCLIPHQMSSSSSRGSVRRRHGCRTRQRGDAQTRHAVALAHC